jgi:hypothetical protein
MVVVALAGVPNSFQLWAFGSYQIAATRPVPP